jgi:hypothetical protein
MTQVVFAARDTLRDPDHAPVLWGRTIELCEIIEQRGHSENQLAMVTALREDIRAGVRNTHDLADEIVWFVRAIEHDLVDDELDSIVDEVVRCDQFDG